MNHCKNIKKLNSKRNQALQHVGVSSSPLSNNPHSARGSGYWDFWVQKKSCPLEQLFSFEYRLLFSAAEIVLHAYNIFFIRWISCIRMLPDFSNYAIGLHTYQSVSFTLT